MLQDLEIVFAMKELVRREVGDNVADVEGEGGVKERNDPKGW